MEASTPVQRQWRILIALMYRRQGQTVKELSQEFQVNTRTILRDLNTLRSAGFPLAERVSDFGRKHWRLVEGGPQDRLRINNGLCPRSDRIFRCW